MPSEIRDMSLRAGEKCGLGLKNVPVPLATEGDSPGERLTWIATSPPDMDTRPCIRKVGFL